jgi:glycosyltransferase involved in cell wall biosynthesis
MAKHQPLVSIVTPTYNQERFLEATIQSALAQTYSPIEYLIINDGSTDSTSAILQRYQDRGIRVIEHKNIGQTATINKGWALSRGDIIAWLNSDDLLAPYAVEQAVAALQANPAALGVYGNCVNIDADGTETGAFPVRPFALRDLLLGYGWGPFAQPSTFFRRTVLDAVGFLDPEIYYCMDFDYVARTLVHGSMVYCNDRPWSYNRMHAEAKSVNPVSKARAAADFIYVYRKLLSMAALPAEVRSVRRQAFAVMHYHSARRLRRGSKKLSAFQHLVLSLLMAPECNTVHKLKLTAKWVLGKG